MTSTVHYSSDKSDWCTPPDLFKFLDSIFEFHVDACASYKNTFCTTWYDEGDSFLDNTFTHESAFMNPPYRKPVKPCKPSCKRDHDHISEYIPGTGDFVDHAYELSKKNNTFVCLLPARLGSDWFDTVWKADCLVFVKGRIKFVGAKSGAPFPSVIAVFGRGVSKQEQERLSSLGRVFVP